MFQGRESTHGYYSIRQNLLCYEVGPRPDLTGGGNEGYHAHSSHGGLPDAARLQPWRWIARSSERLAWNAAKLSRPPSPRASPIIFSYK